MVANIASKRVKIRDPKDEPDGRFGCAGRGIPLPGSFISEGTKREPQLILIDFDRRWVVFDHLIWRNWELFQQIASWIKLRLDFPNWYLSPTFRFGRCAGGRRRRSNGLSALKEKIPPNSLEYFYFLDSEFYFFNYDPWQNYKWSRTALIIFIFLGRKEWAKR